MARVHSHALVLSAYAYWSLSRAKWIIKYLSPTGILFHVTSWKYLILIFQLERWVHLLSFITLFLVTTTTSWPSQKQDLKLTRRPLTQPKETSAYVSWHSVVIQREEEIIIQRNNAFIFQQIPSDYYNTPRDQCGQHVCWKQDSWHSLSTF